MHPQQPSNNNAEKTNKLMFQLCHSRNEKEIEKVYIKRTLKVQTIK